MKIFTEETLDGAQSTLKADTKSSFSHSLKIAYCLPDKQWVDEIRGGFPKNAAHIQQKYIANGLQEQGHSLTYIAPRDLEQIVYAKNNDELALAPCTWSSQKSFVLLSKTAWKFQQFFGIPYLNFFSNYRRFDACLKILPGHDLVFERNALYNVGVSQACKKLGLPYVIFFDADQIMELDFMGKPLTGLLLWRAIQLLRFNLKAADCIICVTEAGKRHLIHKWSVPAKKIVVFPNAVQVDRFRPDQAARAQVRASLGLSDEPIILFVGNFYHWHDVTTLLKAFTRSLKVCPEARLVLVGDGERRVEMIKQAAELGLGGAVKFTGLMPHSEVPHFIAAADIAVVPYPPMQQEMWLSPLKLFEYMASGKAVAASAIGQINDVIQDGENGLLVPPGDATAMADALIKMLTDTNLRSKLGSKAREHAKQKFSWDNYLSRLERVFAAILRRQPVDSI